MASFKGFLASDFKGAFPFTMTVLKIMDFKENDLFQENEQNEYISVKLQISVLLTKFSKESLIPFVVSSQKIVYFHKMNRFS